MATKNERIVPCVATLPGSILKTELEERGISQTSFAKQIGMQKSHLSELIRGVRPMTSAIADKLETALGIPAIIFVNLQSNYDYDVKKIKERDEQEAKAYDTILLYNGIFDVKTLFTRKGFNEVSKVSQLNFLCEKALLPPPQDLAQESAGMFRKSGTTGKDARMLMTWKIIAEMTAREQHVTNSFNPQCRDNLLLDLRIELHKNKNTEERIKQILNEYGIVFCIVEKVNKASVDGYSFIENNVPYIILTKRYDRIDNFAFSLLHEIGHIFLHHPSNRNGSAHLSIPNYDNNSVREKEADNFAANALIPENLWQTAPEVKLNPFIIQNKYSKWAKEHGLNKWIVLGRIANETGMYMFKADESRKIS